MIDYFLQRDLDNGTEASANNTKPLESMPAIENTTQALENHPAIENITEIAEDLPVVTNATELPTLNSTEI